MTKKQILARVGQIVLVLLGISFITFALVMLAPGDVVRQMIAGNEDIFVSQAEIDALRKELGLDKPFFFQSSKKLVIQVIQDISGKLMIYKIIKSIAFWFLSLRKPDECKVSFT